MTWRAMFWITALGLVGAGCTGGGDAAPGSKPSAQASALAVSAADVAEVREARLESGVSFTGEMTPQTTTRITSRFDGDLERVLVKEGERVRVGKPLAVFAPRDVTEILEAAEADVAAAQATLVAAQSQEARARRLLEAGAAAPMDVEAAESARAAAQARVSAALAARNTARDNAERLRVPSPIRGWVSEIFVHDGDRTAIGDPLFTLVNTDTLELSATLPSETLGQVRPGTPIRFRMEAFPEEDFRGVIDRVAPVTEPGTRQIRLYTRVPNPDGKLVGGLYAAGRVILEVRENALAAPVGAVRKEGTNWVVYRVSGGTARRVVVDVGLSDEAAGLVELLGEVAAGDTVLIGVLPGVRDGAPVRVLDGK